MLSLPFLKKNLGAPLQSRKAMLETLVRHLDMVRLSAGAILMVAAVGCTGLINGGSDGHTDQQRDALQRWDEDAFPILQKACQVCHNGSRPNIGFLVGADSTAVRDMLFAYSPSVVNFDAPGSSRLITKGAHDGPALNASDSSKMLQWLQAEKDAREHDPEHPVQVFKVTSFTPMLCTGGEPDSATCPTNHISLGSISGIGPSLAGVEITFNAQALSSLYITNLKLSGGTSGVYVEHPLFVSLPAGKEPFPDQIDRLFDVKENVAAAKVEQLDGGTHSFSGFVPTDPLEIHFKLVSAYKPDTGGGVDTGACKALDKFMAQAVAPLKASCSSCHGNAGNAGAVGAMDLTQIDAAVATTCAQVKSRINLTNTDQSGFYIAPDPGAGANAHPFHFNPAANFTTFKNSVDVWVQAEKTAP